MSAPAEFFMKGEPGEAFAANMFNVAPEDFAFLKSIGAETLIEQYRHFPQAWNAVQYREADFISFMQEFCAFDPNADEGPAPPDNGDDGVVDLEKEEANS